MATAALIVAAVVGALIQRRPSDDLKRWRLARAWSGIGATTLSVISIVCVSSRGYSVSSVFIIGMTLLLVGLYLVLVVRIDWLPTIVGGERAVTVLMPRSRHRNRRLARSLGLWCVLAVVFALVPLRYAGALVRNSPAARVAGVVALGHFAALAERRAISPGQCLLERHPRFHNTVVPCGHPHRSEVVAAIDPSKTCPDISQFEHEGLALRVSVVGPFDEVKYCVIQSESATRSWTGGIRQEGLAPTL